MHGCLCFVHKFLNFYRVQSKLESRIYKILPVNKNILLVWRIRYPDILPKDTLPKDILPKDILPNGHFADGRFAERTFCQADSLPNGQFAERTVCRK